jgi:hypothetical protein
MNNRWKAVLVLVLLVLMSAFGLKELATGSSANPTDLPSLVANGSGPPPPPPWEKK